MTVPTHPDDITFNDKDPAKFDKLIPDHAPHREIDLTIKRAVEEGKLNAKVSIVRALRCLLRERSSLIGVGFADPPALHLRHRNWVRLRNSFESASSSIAQLQLTSLLSQSVQPDLDPDPALDQGEHQGGQGHQPVRTPSSRLKTAELTLLSPRSGPQNYWRNIHVHCSMPLQVDISLPTAYRLPPRPQIRNLVTAYLTLLSHLEQTTASPPLYIIAETGGHRWGDLGILLDKLLKERGLIKGEMVEDPEGSTETETGTQSRSKAEWLHEWGWKVEPEETIEESMAEEIGFMRKTGAI